MNKLINIVSLGRSGTSVLAKFISEFNKVNIGVNLLGADEHNKKGYFENRNIFNVNEAYLRENTIGIWETKNLTNEQKEVYNTKFAPILKNFFQSKYNEITSSNNYEHFVIKEPRILKLFEMFNDILHESSFDEVYHILLLRHPDAFRKSVMKLWPQYIPEDCYKSWYFLTMHFFKYIQPHEKVIMVSFENFIENMEVERKRIENFLSLSISNDAFENFKTNFFDASLVHQTSDEIENEYISEMYSYLINHLSESVHSIRQEKSDEWQYNYNFLK